MKNGLRNVEMEHVAAVIGSEVRIYGAVRKDSNGKPVRPLLMVLQFGNHGQAKLYAQTHDELA